jgi:endonuclease/exonuclease/phosphatase family metal-dependent hydrolase
VRLSVASINLHCGLDRHGRPFPAKAAIASLGADVVLVQENWCPQGTDSLARAAGADCGYPEFTELAMTDDVPLGSLEIGCPVPDETGAWGLAMMSRVPLTGLTTVGVGSAPGDVVGSRKAQIAEAAGVRLVNVHLTHRLLHGPGQLRRLVTGLGDGPPTIIAGDLNMFWPTVLLGGPYRRALSGRTFPAHRPLVQIDHLLAGPGVAIERAQVLPGVGSDHLPLRVDLDDQPARRSR